MKVPDRIAWAVELLDPAPGDRILEFGCGPGVAAHLVANRLDGGHLTAIDRSATAVERARARNADHLAAGRLTVEQVDLAGFRGEPARFDKAFAVNVNVFWTSPADPECRVLARVLRPGGLLLLVYGGPSPGDPRDVGGRVASTLEPHGFAAQVVRHPGGALLAIAARLDESA
jgi:SAM-dependent methyltransferase